MSGGGRASRRQFIKAATVAAGALGASVASRGSEAAGKDEKGLPITIAGYRYDRVQSLIDGRTPVAGCRVRFQEARIGDLNTHVFSGPRTIEVAEIGLHPYMLAYANDGFRGYSLIPVFPLRLFRHKSIFVRSDRGIATPEDLRGKTIATPGYSSTSLTWIRGVLQHEYGVRPTDVEWLIGPNRKTLEALFQYSHEQGLAARRLTIEEMFEKSTLDLEERI